MAATKAMPYDTVALLLQGDGALGAYQAGVFEGLAEAGIEPHWVAGRHWASAWTTPGAAMRPR